MEVLRHRNKLAVRGGGHSIPKNIQDLDDAERPDLAESDPAHCRGGWSRCLNVPSNTKHPMALWAHEGHLGPLCVNQSRAPKSKVGNQGVGGTAELLPAWAGTLFHSGFGSDPHRELCRHSWVQRGLDSKLQIKSMHLEHGVTLRLTCFILFKNPQTEALCNPHTLQDPLFRENTAFLFQNHINPRNQGCWQLLG